MDDFSASAIHNDASRYRLNIMIDGLDAFAEMDLIGHTARIGTAEFDFIEPVGRCAAIDVDPRSGKRRGSLVRASTSLWAYQYGRFCESHNLAT